MVDDEKKESLLTFPCDFTLKVVGKDTNTFYATVSGIVRHYVPDVPDSAFLDSSVSKKGNYRSMSVTIHVTSKEQLDAIYRALSSSPEVLMAL